MSTPAIQGKGIGITCATGRTGNLWNDNLLILRKENVLILRTNYNSKYESLSEYSHCSRLYLVSHNYEISKSHDYEQHKSNLWGM